ncbi:MAG: hypothetical protein JSU89_10710 [Myxococcales bacterium]|nr:MAG: hypothetical protein JSU89_10710 [Myxococcales bacterium]
MKKLLSALAITTICSSLFFAPSSASAVPKMDVKVAVGVGSTTLVPRVPDIEIPNWNPPPDTVTVGSRTPATFANWGLFLSARVRAGKIFGEMAIGFSRFYFDVSEELVAIGKYQNPDSRIDELLGETARMNSLEIPLTAGYVPYANPYFKLFIYGGWVSQFNIRGFVDLNGNRKALKFKPKDVPGYPFAIYVAGFRLGTQFDLGPLNFDFNYTISMNSATKTDFRTNSHVFRFLLGWLF